MSMLDLSRYIEADQDEKSAWASTVKSESGAASGSIRATMAADSRCAGDGAIPDAFGMAVDQQNQLVPIH